MDIPTMLQPSLGQNSWRTSGLLDPGRFGGAKRGVQCSEARVYVCGRVP
jgi:hypothetical protein